MAVGKGALSPPVPATRTGLSLDRAPPAVKSFTAPVTVTAEASVELEPVSGVHSYDDLKNGVPSGVDPSRKEEYLTDAEFQTVFATDRKAFNAQPKWKRTPPRRPRVCFRLF